MCANFVLSTFIEFYCRRRRRALFRFANMKTPEGTTSINQTPERKKSSQVYLIGSDADSEMNRQPHGAHFQVNQRHICRRKSVTIIGILFNFTYFLAEVVFFSRGKQTAESQFLSRRNPQHAEKAASGKLHLNARRLYCALIYCRK